MNKELSLIVNDKFFRLDKEPEGHYSMLLRDKEDITSEEIALFEEKGFKLFSYSPELLHKSVAYRFCFQR